MEMPEESNVTLQLRIPGKLVDQIDQHRQSQKLLPTRSQMIRYLLERALVVEMNEQRSLSGG